MHISVCVGARSGIDRLFLLEFAILLVDLNYVYCVIIFFYGMQLPFRVFILPCSNLSVLNVTVSSFVQSIYANGSQSSFQLFLSGVIAT